MFQRAACCAILSYVNRHRMPQDHQCIIEERKRERKEKMSAAANAAKKGKYDTAVRNATNKTNPTALKVAMMKMKMHASVFTINPYII